MNRTLDTIDRRILDELQKNGRLSSQALADLFQRDERPWIGLPEDWAWRDDLNPGMAQASPGVSGPIGKWQRTDRSGSSPPAVALFAALVVLGFLAVKAWSRTLAEN